MPTICDDTLSHSGTILRSQYVKQNITSTKRLQAGSVSLKGINRNAHVTWSSQRSSPHILTDYLTFPILSSRSFRVYLFLYLHRPITCEICIVVISSPEFGLPDLSKVDFGHIHLQLRHFHRVFEIPKPVEKLRSLIVENVLIYGADRNSE